MQKSNLTTKKVIALTLAAMTLISSSVFANIYKWRDSRGRAQYSDTLPATSYSIVERSELVNALQSKDVCTLPSAKSNAIAQTKLQKLSANFGFTVSGFPKPSTSISRINPLSSVGSTAKLPTNFASITKFLASHPMPAIISPAAASNEVKPVSKPTLSPTPTPVAKSAAVATNPAPTNVAISLPPNIVQAALMPAVDISKNMIPAIGFDTLRLEQTSEKTNPTGGAFRIYCKPSHMSNDDPIVYPNQPGAAHHHTFFGNTATSAKSDLTNFKAKGNSTCNGGIMNKSAYWIPSIIDTSTKTPIQPDAIMVYYKTGDIGYISTEPIIQPPKGLRMISGNSKATLPDQNRSRFVCETGGAKWGKTIPNCDAGVDMTFGVDFPQCWDGKNLDSPDHKSHMADRVFISNTSIEMRCPADHPFRIPAIAFNVHYKNTVKDAMKNWRLSSDNYPTTTAGGLSAHADWVNGWDEKLLGVIMEKCLRAAVDCHATLIGDGRKMY